jgi:hypothetical protein
MYIVIKVRRIKQVFVGMFRYCSSNQVGQLVLLLY